MAAVEAFGVVAISIMVASYALEKRSPIYIATFALGCALAAGYAYLLESYPFFVAEILWAGIAVARFRRVTLGTRRESELHAGGKRSKHSKGKDRFMHQFL